jgi:hypothetical protein
LPIPHGCIDQDTASQGAFEFTLIPPLNRSATRSVVTNMTRPAGRDTITQGSAWLAGATVETAGPLGITLDQLVANIG